MSAAIWSTVAAIARAVRSCGLRYRMRRCAPSRSHRRPMGGCVSAPADRPGPVAGTLARRTPIAFTGGTRILSRSASSSRDNAWPRSRRSSREAGGSSASRSAARPSAVPSTTSSLRRPRTLCIDGLRAGLSRSSAGPDSAATHGTRSRSAVRMIVAGQSRPASLTLRPAYGPSQMGPTTRLGASRTPCLRQSARLPRCPRAARSRRASCQCPRKLRRT